MAVNRKGSSGNGWSSHFGKENPAKTKDRFNHLAFNSTGHSQVTDLQKGHLL